MTTPSTTPDAAAPPRETGSLAVIRRRVRDAIPAVWRRRLRRWAREGPVRLTDAIPDAFDLLRGTANRLPPPRLRARVSLSSSRREFERAGALAAADVLRAFEICRRPGRPYARWLDFGCGVGRVTRHVARSGSAVELHGVDVDADAIRWLAASHPPGRFVACGRLPPANVPASSFDVVYAVSVFTHFDETMESAWLEELDRLLCPGGLLIASTLSTVLTFTRPDLTVEQHREMNQRGFLFAPGGGTFNDDAAFEARSRVERVWGKKLTPRLFEEQGLAGYQDLSVWEKPG
ncbi:MAG: class I SAM-dependent methyltransferase [Thermoanaerobaculia bacterium]